MPNGHKSSSELKIRQKLGKYRIERRLGAGGFAAVYQAMDTVQGIRVAIKVPHSQYTTDAVLTEFRKEIRERMTELGMDHEFARRYLNDGFSGGENVGKDPDFCHQKN